VNKRQWFNEHNSPDSGTQGPVKYLQPHLSQNPVIGEQTVARNNFRITEKSDSFNTNLASLKICYFPFEFVSWLKKTTWFRAFAILNNFRALQNWEIIVKWTQFLRWTIALNRRTRYPLDQVEPPLNGNGQDLLRDVLRPAHQDRCGAGYHCRLKHLQKHFFKMCLKKNNQAARSDGINHEKQWLSHATSHMKKIADQDVPCTSLTTSDICKHVQFDIFL